MNLPKTGSILRRLLIIIPVVVGLTLISLFMPAQQLNIEGIGILSFETTVTLSVGSEVAYASPDTESLYPTGQVTWTNLGGSYLDVDDDPDSPDANWADALSNTADTVAHVSFTSPSGNLNTGADLQEFKIYVRKSAAGGTNPEVQIELYESGNVGNPLAQTALLEVTSDSGELFNLTWDASLLADISGVDVECRIYGKKSGGSPANKRTVEVGAVEWNVDYSAAVPEITVSPTNYDFDVVAESSTPYTITTYFAIDNNSTMQTDQTIGVTTTTWSGGIPWDHAEDAVPGADLAGLKANRGGTWGTGDIIVKNISPNYIYENCPANTDYSFGLRLLAPTSFSDGVPKQIIVMITAVAG